jgi:hypothetical protein
MMLEMDPGPIAAETGRIGELPGTRPSTGGPISGLMFGSGWDQNRPLQRGLHGAKVIQRGLGSEAEQTGTRYNVYTVNKEHIRDGLLIVIMTIGLFAIGAQFYLAQTTRSSSLFLTSLNFFSYFTILTDILVSGCVMMLLFSSKGSRSFFVRDKTISAVAVYITIVGVIYNFNLRQAWHLETLHNFADELLHTVIPILFVIYWIGFVSKNKLMWKDILPWQIYPSAYSAYTLIHGAIANWYPYPFINPNNGGWIRIAINTVFILITFIAVSSIFIGFGKLRNYNAT